MSTHEYHLAQVNVARMLAPIEDPMMADFVNRLDEINALADTAPGFVWRLQTEGGNALDIRPNDDHMLLINLSVWEDIESLYQYTYYSAHAEVYRRRQDWFELVERPTLTLWWIPAGHIPSVDEAMDRLSLLRVNGPSPDAFTFKQRFSLEEYLAHLKSHQA